MYCALVWKGVLHCYLYCIVSRDCARGRRGTTHCNAYAMINRLLTSPQSVI